MISVKLVQEAKKAGQAIVIRRKTILGIALAICLIVPIILPVWLVPVLGKFLKADILISW